MNLSKEFVDSIEVTVADSFVFETNKLGKGHGEAKLYLGKDDDLNRNFFGPFGFEIKGFIGRDILVRYLNDMKSEYLSPTLHYRKSSELPRLWEERLSEVNVSPEKIVFQIEDQTQVSHPGLYVNSPDKGYGLIRRIALPEISRLFIIKWVIDGEYVFEFRLLPLTAPLERSSLYFDEINAILSTTEFEESSVKTTIVNRLVKARVGQDKFRKAVLQECRHTCPFTNITDEGLLRAGHIKPWALCDNTERLNPQNGLAFSPTFDVLFNDGFITFTDDRHLLLSPLLSRNTIEVLGIFNDQLVDIPLDGAQNRQRREFMSYHRSKVFRA